MTSLASHSYDSASHDDDGSAAPNVAAALSAYASGMGGPADVIAALSAGRLLVPVVAMLDEADADGSDKSSHMATVQTTGKDGRSGLLAFTSLDAMRTWNHAARPVPVPTRRAAESALADGADALVIDIAGPVTFSVDAGELRALASGWRMVADDGGGPAWAVAVGLAERGADTTSDATSDAEPEQPGRLSMPGVALRIARSTMGVLRSRISGAVGRRRAKS